ncbi:aldo/keto reductase [Herbaspirillum robiniae]|uniref:Aldo/keto reductase n=1 Tax=Herbaspirillum robiniae TaxID=2014887 RepID=A0ABX2LSZ3_9BURK|nr:aldo/keto reductase [Herbaspirillum robiniae]
MRNDDRSGRRQVLQAGLAAALAAGLPAAPAMAEDRMQQRRIASGAESLPVIGCGTYIGFDVAPGSEEYRRLPDVVDALLAAGGAVFDSSPMYGRAERTTGELLAAEGKAGQAFLATKVWTAGREAGIAQMRQSMRLLGVQKLDLMQIHNLLDWRIHLQTLREWKAQGLIRYIGVTHYTAGAYAELEAVMRAEQLDFLQINYSFDEREAEQRILPLAAERGMAVLVNRPFGGGGLLGRTRGKPLPPWAAEIGATSWAQLLLKFILANPAVTCAIPGTARPEHMRDNAAAGMGLIPAASFWREPGHAIDI